MPGDGSTAIGEWRCVASKADLKRAVMIRKTAGEGAPDVQALRKKHGCPTGRRRDAENWRTVRRQRVDTTALPVDQVDQIAKTVSAERRGAANETDREKPLFQVGICVAVSIIDEQLLPRRWSLCKEVQV